MNKKKKTKKQKKQKTVQINRMIEKYNLPAPIGGDKEVFWVKESVFRLYHAVFQVTKIALHPWPPPGAYLCETVEHMDCC